MDQGIVIYYRDEVPQTFSTTQYTCQGGFVMIIEDQGGKFVTKCIPSDRIKEIVVTQLS